MYNAALQERKYAWTLSKKSISYFDQCLQVKEIRKEGLTKLASSSCCMGVLKQVDNAFTKFFGRMKAGKWVNPPRFKSYTRYRILNFPVFGNGISIKQDGKLMVRGIGRIKLKLHRPLTGKIKTAALVKECGKWFVSFCVEVEIKPLTHSSLEVGIDVGLIKYAALSNGEFILNPKFGNELWAAIAVKQRKVARCQKNSKGREKAILDLQKQYLRLKNKRINFSHGLSRDIVNRFGLIAIEALDIKGMMADGKYKLTSQIKDASWGSFFTKLTYKAESAGRLLVKVDPRGTSQRCSSCGSIVPKPLSQRWHDCPNCKLSVCRDQNSAMEILRLGRSLTSVTRNKSLSVLVEAAA